MRGQRSLVRRLESILVSTIGAALVAALLLITAKEFYVQRAAQLSAAQAWLNTLAVQAASPLAFDDPRGGADILGAASIYPGLQAAFILRPDGSRLAQHLARGQVDDPRLTLAEANRTGLFSDALYLRTPVWVSQERVGEVAAQVDLRPMWRSVAEFGLSLLLVLGGAGLAAALAARRYLHRALAPIADLKQVVEQVAQGRQLDLRAPIQAPDEVGALTQGFNQMLDQIALRDAQLAEKNANLLALKDAAEQASTLKTEFLALMSHELRTPMAGVLGMLQLSLRGQMDAVARERVELACRNASVLVQIVNDLLDVSKIEAGKLTLERLSFGLQPMVTEVMDLMRDRAAQKSIAFTLDWDPAIPPYVQGDPTRLRQVLLNLVGNALKFTERGHVSLRVNRLSGVAPDSALRLHFEVEDSGVGIDAQAQQRLFRKFEQADKSTTRRFGGTGLGLSICKQLVDLMGGQIGLHSRPGQGSRFFFELPLPRGEAPAKDAELALGAHEASLHVLVAEDAPTNQLIVEALLQEMGHSVRLVENGEQALQALLQEPFDLILMDGRMPVMDGLEATRHIRAGWWHEQVIEQSHIPIVALTANASDQDRVEFLAAGMDDFLTKPLEEAALHRVLSEVIAQHRRTGTVLRPAGKRDTSESSAAQVLAQLDALLLAPAGSEPVQALSSRPAPQSTPSGSDPRRAQLSADLRERMVGVFIEQAPLRLLEIEDAMRAGDWERAAVTAHGLKGSLAYVAPDSPAYRLAQQLEELADGRQGPAFVQQFDAFRSAIEAACIGAMEGGR